MAADDRPIIIKRIKKSGGGHHGGAWKVAYADFVTAMMAFFLLLWLLSATTEAQKKGLADYFDPTIAAASQSGQIAVMDGQPAVLETMSGASAAQADIEGDEEVEDPSTTANAPKPTEDGETPVNEKEAEEVMRAQEAARFEEVKEKIQQVIAQTPDLSGLQDNLLIDQTPEGMRIQLLDKEKESMFASGSATMEARSRELLALVAQAVKDMPNKLAISGHTDASPYVSSDGRSNWELSSDRANAARRELVQGGVDPGKVKTVEGRADTDPFIKEDPADPQNRRISIILLTDVPQTPPAGSDAPAAATPSEPAQPPAEIIPPAE